MGGQVLRARDAAKQSVTALDAFGSTGEGPIGRVNGARVTLARRHERGAAPAGVRPSSR